MSILFSNRDILEYKVPAKYTQQISPSECCTRKRTHKRDGAMANQSTLYAASATKCRVQSNRGRNPTFRIDKTKCVHKLLLWSHLNTQWTVIMVAFPVVFGNNLFLIGFSMIHKCKRKSCTCCRICGMKRGLFTIIKINSFACGTNWTTSCLWKTQPTEKTCFS
jgi:hypothetical protein